MAEKLNSLRNLFEHEIRELYDAERQITKAFPKFIERASNNELEDTLRTHLRESEQELSRLENICSQMDVKPNGVTSRGIEGLIREAEELLKIKDDPEVMDAALIAAVQKIEHYEIAAYGTVCTYAELLDLPDIKKTLGESLNEEKNTDTRLTEIAKQINQAALV